ncbi:MAG: restriction endonuclease subunit S [Thermoanaerobacteraceae bacterium]|nr:restriction endonuclease subunit S [Thermoanaerobacteraceae bacterium]
MIEDRVKELGSRNKEEPRKMKDSGVEWIGEIPREWRVVKNKYVFKSKKKIIGGQSKNYELLSLTKSKGIIYRDINNNEGKLPASFDTYQEVVKGDLVLCLFDLDISAVFSDVSRYDGMISPAYSIFDISQDCITRYYKYWFEMVGDGRKYRAYSKSLRNTIDVNNFNNILSIVPPQQEQQAIANYLDSKVALIDNIIEKTKQSIEDYKKYKQSLITETVTKGLNPDVEMKDSGIEWIGEVPKHWEVFRLRYLFRFNNGLTITRSDLKESGVSCINYGDIHSKYTFDLDLKRDSLPKVDEDFKLTRPNALLNNGDFVFCDTSEDLDGSGNFVFIRDTDGKEIFAGSHTTIAKPKINLNSAYVGYLLKSFGVKRQFEREVVGVKVYSITQDVLKNIELVLPPLDEQEEIARYLDYKRIQVDEIISKKKCLIKDLETYKKSLIYECVTGKRYVG